MAVEGVPDLELVERARAGDDGAFRVLVERYESQVAGTVVGMLGPGADAEEVGQDAFVRFYESLHRFRGEASVGTYVTRIAINLALNASKRRKRDRWRFWSRDRDEDPAPDPVFDGRDAVDQAGRDQLVQEAVQELKPDHRAVVVLRMLEGYSTKEAAEVLEIPEGTVLSRLARGMAHLKTILGERMADDET
ncbi:MAG: RNA polymerase sigma factor [Gemmatimonadetes bacterium]|jgi:RNA polymerase sigma-70 factor, ECF subfamily|nr:RNA polymerase sigma factor [Gemmatimonadota bacterium]MBT7859435.1 RNA polymerase sigma factor [Gemmatimonadota bacterium]